MTYDIYFKVGSRIVIQVGGIIMIVLGCFGKFGALFVTIPEPVVGGMFLVMFGEYINVREHRRGSQK